MLIFICFLVATCAAHFIGYVWDKLTFIPWYIASGMSRKLAIARRMKSVQDADDPSIWSSGDSNEVIETYYYGYRTMPEIFAKTIQKYSSHPMLGKCKL